MAEPERLPAPSDDEAAPAPAPFSPEEWRRYSWAQTDALMLALLGVTILVAGIAVSFQGVSAEAAGTWFKVTVGWAYVGGAVVGVVGVVLLNIAWIRLLMAFDVRRRASRRALAEGGDSP